MTSKIIWELITNSLAHFHTLWRLALCIRPVLHECLLLRSSIQFSTLNSLLSWLITFLRVWELKPRKASAISERPLVPILRTASQLLCQNFARANDPATTRAKHLKWSEISCRPPMRDMFLRAIPYKRTTISEYFTKQMRTPKFKEARFFTLNFVFYLLQLDTTKKTLIH